MADFARVMGRLLRLEDDIPNIDLTGSMIGDDGATALASALCNNSSVTELYLTRNAIGDEGCAALAAALSVNAGQNITVLSLADNHIGADGATALAAALRNTAITKLNLNMNRIGNAGMIALSDYLRDDASLLARLEVAQNNITTDGAESLVAALRYNTTLLTLNFLQQHSIDNELRAEIYGLVAINRAPHNMARVIKRSVYPIIKDMPESVLPHALERIGKLPERFALSTVYRFVKETSLD